MKLPRVGDLLVNLLAKIDELAVGETFTQIDESKVPATYNQVPLAAYMYRLPDEALGDDKPAPYPYLTAYKLKGKDSESFGGITIRLVFGLWNEDPIAGEDDVERMIELILGLAEDQDFSPWSLESDIVSGPFDEDGIQPHPEYFGYVDISFMRESSFNII